MKRKLDPASIVPAKIQTLWEMGMLYLVLTIVFQNIIVHHLFAACLSLFGISIYVVTLQIGNALLALLFLSAVGYLLFTRFRYPNTMPRVKAYLKHLLRPEIILTICLILWFVICCIQVGKWQGGNYLYVNSNAVYVDAVSLLLMFPLATLSENRAVKKTVLALVHASTLLQTAKALFVMYLLVTGSNGLTRLSTVYMYESRLYVGAHPNAVGGYAGLLIMVCLYMIASRKRAPVKALYISAAIIQYVILSLTNSRTSVASTALGVGSAAMIMAWRMTRKRSPWTRMFAGLMALAITALFINFARNGVFYLYNRMVAESAGAGATRPISDEDIGTLAIRGVMWKAALQAIFTNRQISLFGATPFGVGEVLDYFMQRDYNTYTHNQFLEIGVSLGIPGLLLYTSWLVLLARHCLRVSFARQGLTTVAQRILPVVILSLVVGNLAEAYLLLRCHVVEPVFFLTAGYVMHISRSLPKHCIRPTP